MWYYSVMTISEKCRNLAWLKKMNFGMWQHLWHLIIQTLVGLVEGSER